ncbi:MAG TPA: membrane protein insertase YidC [Pyrinomonadaceae bacterium]|jgi:YidC/Oxa1 family membrane protein insertase|nr:membrane protein insertase YidC [Pyrinomonadaceae bacterium]
MQQKRLVFALLISMVILIGWTYLFPIKTPQNANSNKNPPANTASPGTTPASPIPVPSASATPAPIVSNQSVRRRVIEIKTPLYDAKFDNQGAVATSWILRINKDNGAELHSAGSDKNHKLPLELISQDGLTHVPREAPFTLVTSDAALDDLLANRNFEIEGYPDSDSELQISLAPNEQKRLNFVLRDPATNLEVTKAITFKSESYSTDLEVKVRRGIDSFPQVRIQTGPSIGDQGLKSYSYYSVAPEAVGYVNDSVERHTGQSINENKKSSDQLVLPGDVDWAGIGDTYFAMVVVPARRVQGLEYFTSAYEVKPNGKAEKRYLIRGLVPVPADGSKSAVYLGPKDHYVLQKASAEIGTAVGRRLDLDGLINYGIGGSISRPIAEKLLWCIKKLYQLTGSYGVAIILFTIIIYSAFFPLKWRSSKAMKKAQKHAPKMKELQEKIKGMKQTDPRLKELQMEQLKLMKEANPLGGCLPLLIQMPFLFALYRAITISLDFRQASFLWLPDLSSPEPYLIHILPILMATTMVVLQLITPAPSADPLQRKMMAVGMPMFMLYILWSAPAGLLVYWLVGNIVGFIQQFLINRWTKTDEEKALPEETKAKGKTGKKAPDNSQK